MRLNAGLCIRARCEYHRGVNETLKREMRVAFSRKAQPLWFRGLKWALIVGATALWWRHPAFWNWVLGVLALSLTLHFVWRWKTRKWTQPWGGWDDVDTANGN